MYVSSILISDVIPRDVLHASTVYASRSLRLLVNE